LIALGFALVYGTCRVPNFAHGALYVSHRNYWCADLPVYSDSGARNGHF
jgi:hypothetical protein